MDAAFAHFVETHVRGAQCSVCGNREWFLANDGKPISFLSFGASNNPSVDVVAVCCSACGYMRFHSSDVVESALQRVEKRNE